MKSQLDIKANKKAWEKLRAQLLKPTDTLLMGYFSEDTYDSDNNNLPVAAVAAWQDQGAPFAGEKHIPPRPFMSVGLTEVVKSISIKKAIEMAFINYLGGESLKSQYKHVGAAITDDMKELIEDWDDPPNSPSWANKKGEDNPLVYTEVMKDSFTTKVTKENV